MAEETVFWTEEVENEILRWADEKNKLAEVIMSYGKTISYHNGFKVKSKLENMLSQTTKPSKVADKCLRLREERYSC